MAEIVVLHKDTFGFIYISEIDELFVYKIFFLSEIVSFSSFRTLSQISSWRGIDNLEYIITNIRKWPTNEI